MNDISSELVSLKRMARDVQSSQSTALHLLRKISEPSSTARPAGIVSRFAACSLIARVERRDIATVQRQHFRDDRDLASLIELKSAVPPAQSSVAGWASELIATSVADLLDNLLGGSVLTALRAMSGASYVFESGAVVRAPSSAMSASATFVAEGGAIPALQFALTSVPLPAKKIAGLVAFSKELAKSSPHNVETAMQQMLRDDLTLSVDTILLDANAGDTIRPPGLRFGLTPLAASSAGNLSDKIAADTRALIGALTPPVIAPVMVVAATEGATLDAVGSALTKIRTPVLPAGTVVCVDAASFASAVGLIEFNLSEEALVNMAAPAGAITAGGGLSGVAAPTSSMWQQSLIALRSLLDANWSMRRSGSVSTMTGVAW
jgi:hypothetical protein